MAPPRRTLAAALAATLAFAAASALAQEGSNPLEEVDPDLKTKKKNPVEEVDPGGSEETTTPPPRRGPKAVTPSSDGDTQPQVKRKPGQPDVDPLLLPVKPKPVGSKPLPVGPPAGGEAAPPPTVDASRAPAKAIKLPRSGDAQVLEAWERWKKASKDLDGKGQEAALLQLTQLREELGIADLDHISIGLTREADARAKGGDAPGAVGLATAAAQIAPHLPSAHFALAEARFRNNPAGVVEWGEALVEGVRELWTDPRYARPALGDVGAGTLFALTATALAAVLMLFARKVRYFHHDFHHLLFPRAAAPWQSAAMVALLLSLPVVFHAGLAPLLLVLFAASCLYLSTAERAVGAALVACLGVVPLLGGMLTDATAFSGTPAEDAYALERGGLDAAPAAERVAHRAADGKASYAELYALGRYQLRRGQVDAALERFKLAAAKRPSDARLLTNVGNAMLAKGDADGAADSYKSASQADAALAAPLFNISKLYSRRAKVLRSELVGEELDRAHTARDRASALDPSLAKREDKLDEDPAFNRYLISPELRASDLDGLVADGQGDKVVEQLSATLVGRPGLLSWIYPGLAAALLFFLGFASRSGAVSRACQKCGRPVCRRCDPELPAQSELCAQCVNVFVKKNAVAAPLRVRKQIEVDRHHTRVGRLSYLFGLICSGAGHVFYGLPVRGVAYTFLFLFVGFSVFYRQGVLRPPYGAAPLLLRLLPLGLTFLAVYLLSLRGLYKRQEEA